MPFASPRSAKRMLRLALASLCVILLPSLAQAVPLTGGASTQIPWLRLVLSLAFCLGLAIVAILVMKRMQLGGVEGLLRGISGKQVATTDTFRIIEARRLGPSSQMCLVEFDGREILLVTTDHAVEVIAERTQEPLSETAKTCS